MTTTTTTTTTTTAVTSTSMTQQVPLIYKLYWKFTTDLDELRRVLGLPVVWRYVHMHLVQDAERVSHRLNVFLAATAQA